MSQTMAINALGYNNLYNDPYFWQQFNSNPSFKGSASAQTNAPQQTAASLYTAPNYSTYTSNTAVADKKGSSNAGLILGGIATVGAGVLLYKAHKKGGDKGIAEGFKQIWQGITGKGSGEAVFQLRQNAAKEWIATVPGRSHEVPVSELANFGHSIPTDIPKFGSEGTQLKECTFIHKTTYGGSSVENKILLKGDKVEQYTNGVDDLLSRYTNATEAADIEYKKQLDEIISAIKQGKTPENVTIENLSYTCRANKEGLSSVINSNAGGTTIVGGLTNRFNIASEEAQAYLIRNPELKKAADKVLDGKIPEGLKIASAEYKVNSDTIAIIEDGKIAGVKLRESGTWRECKIDSDGYTVWAANNKDVLKKIADAEKDKKFTNIIYQVK